MTVLSQRVPERDLTRELWVVTKASLSSLAATLADGLVYQLLLFVSVAHYGLIAALGAVAGAIVNFSINRYYTFALHTERVWPQALRYAAVSLLTFIALRGLLWVSIERLAWSPRVAWLPAKLLAFALVSYPLQRLWVFGGKARS